MYKFLLPFACSLLSLIFFSCARTPDIDGDLLNKHYGAPVPKVRKIVREETPQRVFNYYYDYQFRLVRIASDSITYNFEYNGDKIKTLHYKGWTKTIYIEYGQNFFYDQSVKLIKIDEYAKVYNNIWLNGVPAVNNGHTLYKIKYDQNNKIDSVIAELASSLNNDPIPVLPQVVTSHKFHYDANSNVTKVSSNELVNGMNYPYAIQFLNYDQNINPYTLVPFEFSVSQSVKNRYDLSNSIMLSPNNPGKIIKELPAPAAPATTTFPRKYDSEKYATEGFGRKFYYMLY